MDFEDFKFVPYAVEMVLSLSQFPQSPILPASSPRTSANYRSIPTKFKSTLNPITILTAKQRKKNHSYAIIVNAAEEQQQQPTTTESEPAQKPPSDEQVRTEETMRGKGGRCKPVGAKGSGPGSER